MKENNINRRDMIKDQFFCRTFEYDGPGSGVCFRDWQ